MKFSETTPKAGTPYVILQAKQAKILINSK